MSAKPSRVQVAAARLQVEMLQKLGRDVPIALSTMANGEEIESKEASQG